MRELASGGNKRAPKLTPRDDTPNADQDPVIPTHQPEEEFLGGPTNQGLKSGSESTPSLSEVSKEMPQGVQQDSALKESFGSGSSDTELKKQSEAELSPVEIGITITDGSLTAASVSDHSSGVVKQWESTQPKPAPASLQELTTEALPDKSDTIPTGATSTPDTPGHGSISGVGAVVAKKRRPGRPTTASIEKTYKDQVFDRESRRMVLSAQALHGKMLGLSHAQTARAIGVKEHQVKYALQRFEQFFPELEAVEAYLITKTQLFSNMEMRLLKSISGKMDDGALKDVVYAFKEVFHANRLASGESTANTKSQSVSFTKPTEPPKGSSDN